MLSPMPSAFVGTAVEFFETAVIAYAVVRAGYPREAISAVILGHLLVFGLAVLMLPFGEWLPVTPLRWAAALLLVGMGAHWTRKSLRRLRANQRPRWASDPLAVANIEPATTDARAAFSLVAFAAMLKGSLIEGGEILLVAFPLGAATGAWEQVLVGVLCGIAAVCALALYLHRRLRDVPEVKVKLAAGLMLLGLGCLWVVELAFA